MVRSATFSTATLCAVALTVLSVVSNVSAHGYMSSPPPRGIQKASYMVDDLKAPNTKGICRGETPGKVTNVGHSITLSFTITAPHIGMCEVYILDENLGNARKIASKDGCAAPGKVGPWTVEIPSDITGRKVLRWVWNAAHLVTTIEHYEQCADINISGGGDSTPAPSYESKPAKPTEPANPANPSKPSKPGKLGKLAKPETPAPEASPESSTSNEDDDRGYKSAPETKKSDDSAAAGNDSVATPAESEPASLYTNAEPEATPATPAAPTSGTDGCQEGEFRCDGNKVGQCANKSFNWVTCASGTKCQKTAYAIYCG